MDGSQPIGEGGEAVEVIRRVVVIAARSTIAVGAGYAILLVVEVTSLPLGIVPLAMTVVDVGLKIAVVEAGAKIRLVDLLVPAMGVY